MWNLTTDAGDLDLRFVPAGTRGFEDLVRDAVRVDITGITLRVASLADVIRSKEAAGREKDRAALPLLRRLLAEVNQPPAGDQSDSPA
jgi:predicted nucleotidyltransferase